MSAFPISHVRRQFPALSRVHGDRPRVYMDNPAGTQLPRRVIDAVTNALVEAASNYGGFFANSRDAEAIYARAHDGMAEFVNAASPDEIVVAQSMTCLTLHLSRSMGRRFAPGDEIIVTRMDHEGNVSPWLLLAEDLGLVVKWLPFNRDTWTIEPEDLQALLGTPDPTAGAQLREQPHRFDQRRGRPGRDGALGRSVDLRRRRSTRAAPANRRAGARLRLPGVLVVQVLRSPPGSAVGAPGAARRVDGLQGAVRAGRTARQVGNGNASDRNCWPVSPRAPTTTSGSAGRSAANAR